MNFSFVIPSNRPYEAIEPLLLSIQKQLLQPEEVIIVRDRQATLDERNIYHKRIEELFVGTNFKLHIISDHNNKDFSAGKGASYVRNHGRKKVQTPYMIFVDDDNTFDNNFTEKLTQQRKNNPDSVIVPTQYDEQGQIRNNVVAHGFSFRMCRPKRITTKEIERMKEGKNERLLSNSHSLSLNPSVSQSLPITLASSNCLSGPTKIFATYPFDEDIPFSYEDIIMTGQMSTHGVRLFLASEIPIIHNHKSRSKASSLYIDTPLRAYYKSKHRIILIQVIAQKRSDKFLFWLIGFLGQMGWLIMLILLYCPIRDWKGCIGGILKGSRDGMKAVIHV